MSKKEDAIEEVREFVAEKYGDITSGAVDKPDPRYLIRAVEICNEHGVDDYPEVIGEGHRRHFYDCIDSQVEEVEALIRRHMN